MASRILANPFRRQHARIGFVLALLAAPFSAFAADNPNVILILTDDQGYADVGAYGSDDIETPHIDGIAADGTRFTQFYATASVCSPSRASILTGKVPARAGIPGNVPPAPWGRKGIPAEQVTIAELLKDEGYVTAQIGKWHLGHIEGSHPLDQGFDYSFGHLGGCIDNYSHFFYWNGPNRHDLQLNRQEIYRDGEYFPDMMVKEANDFIDRTDGKPFFIYFALNVPHYPYQGDASWLAHYREKGVDYPRDLYGGLVSTLDARIGQVVEHLKAIGAYENTVIIFQSDHGHSTEERAHWGGGSAGPYRGAKFSLFEGGLRVPAIISWPGGDIPAGAVRDQLVTGADWLPTIAEIVGARVDEDELDGRSLLDIANNAEAEAEHDSFLWELDGRWAVRAGDWKLLSRPRDTTYRHDPAELTTDDQLFLVNLEEDPGETTNLRRRHPNKVDELIALRNRKLQRYPEQ